MSYNEYELLANNVGLQKCEACKNCKFRPVKYNDGRTIPEERRFRCGFCQKYDMKPDEVYFDNKDCDLKEEE